MLVIMCALPAFAGWQYDGYYLDDAYYDEDSTKFVLGFRGGMSWGYAKMKNEIGNLDGYYFLNTETGAVISEKAYDIYLDHGGDPAVYLDAGYGDLSKLPVDKDFSKFAFTAGASIGFTIPYHQNWRLEAAYDHIAETEYNQIPLFSGDLTLSGGEIGDQDFHVSSSGATSTVSTDIVSVMAYYDFFSGNKKPMDTMVPYIGLGVGYATSKTTLKLSDIYGDLSTDSDLRNYGTLDADGVIQFEPPADKSKYPTSTSIAAIGTLGLSYGIAEYTYLDFGARVIYIPKITWELVNSDASRHREWFSAENMLYTDVTIGLRFEF